MFNTLVCKLNRAGGGTAGFPLAVRLAETPGVRVGVLEAGAHHTDDPMLDQLRYIGASHGNPKYEWCDKTEPIPSLDGRVMDTPRGKMFGGCTGINHTAWDRGSRADYDAWARFGGAGWSFDELLPYFKKAEDARSVKENPNLFIPASTDVVGADLEGSMGTTGPVKVAYNETETDVSGVFVQTWNRLGVPTNANPFGGEKQGVANIVRAVDIEAGKRTTSASAYLPLANPDKVNVLLGVQVTRVVFDEGGSDGDDRRLFASGVEFTINGEVHRVRAKKEVILCAGAFRSPALLELSGIGTSAHLKGLGIEPLVDLPGVGENLQDQLFVPVQYRLQPEIKTKDLFRNDPDFVKREEARYAETRRGWVMTTNGGAAFLPLAQTADLATYSTLLARIETLIQSEGPTALQRAQYAAQLEMLKAQNTPTFEFLHFAAGFVSPQPGEVYTVLVSGLLVPFSRGFVHIKSIDASVPPQIQPNYYGNELDMDLSLAAFDKYDKFAGSAPWSDVTLERQLPPMPTRKDLEGYVKKSCLSSGHIVGTAAMAPREIVVGGDLRVHGTKNLRVVDASVFPIAVAAHTQATVYALAEKVILIVYFIIRLLKLYRLLISSTVARTF
ncbi:GMC oxidoreductase [Peniophora sp. CONT]|nr:GMC oxidoreductase [Peniophora sp. CONT]